MRLAIVDDAAVMRALVASVARDLGHDVVATYASVDAARAGLATAAVDVVLFDGRIAVAPESAGGARTDESDVAGVVRALEAACASGTSDKIRGGRERPTRDGRRDGERVAILVVAALDERSTVEAAKAGGAVGAVLRPVTHRGLATALDAMPPNDERASAT